MTETKQRQVLACFAAGRYKVVDDQIYSFRKAANEWKPLKANLLPGGYSQITMGNGIRNGNGIHVIVYKHIAIYLAVYGEYPEGWQIDHKDRNNKNDHPDNLQAKSPVENIANSERNTTGAVQTIRGKEIAAIRRLKAEGGTQAGIARTLNLNRLSVRNIIKKIEAGEPLKYENWMRRKHEY